MVEQIENNSGAADASLRAVEQRWGDLSKVGFTAVPNTLMHAQAKLDLSPTDVVVLMNLAMHWWTPTDLPFPRTTTIAKRAGLTERSVQRVLKGLEKRGFIARIKSRDRTYVDLSGLKEKLAAVAPDYAWRRDTANREMSELD